MRLSIQFFSFQIAIILFVAINYGDTAAPTPIICDKNLIKGQAADYVYDSNNSKLKCKDDKIIKVGTTATLYDELKCDAAGWTTDGTTKLTPPFAANAEIDIGCVPICVDDTPAPPQVEREPDQADPKKFTFSCRSDNAAVLVISDGTNDYSNKITCSKDGWKDGSAVIAEAEKKLSLSCKKYCEALGTPTGNFEFSLGQNNDQIEFKCNDNKFALFTGNEMLAADSKCTKVNGWEVGMTTPPSKETPLTVECKEVCTYDNSGADLQFDSNSTTLKCKASTKELHVGGIKYQQLICDPYKGWRKDVTDSSIIAPSHEKLSATCQDPTPPNCTFTVAQASAALVADTATEPGTAKIACAERKFNLANNALQFKNGSKEVFAHSNLICDSTGWKDTEDNILFPSDTQLEFSCAASPCNNLNKGMCSSFESKGYVPEGYECIGSTFDRVDDPNVAACDTNDRLIIMQNEKIMDENNLKFIDTKLRCQGDNEWHKFGETTKTEFDSNLLMCLKKLCSKCIAPPLTDPTTGDNPITPTAATFTEGSSTECATIKCPNDLWLIEVTREKEDLSEETLTEQYAGPITCASDKERDSQWTIVEINGENKVKSVDKVGCITEVKCTEAVKITTDCDPNWTGGCDKIGDSAGLSDTSDNKCPAGKKIYFKQSNDQYFGESTDGDLIKCDKDKGVWEVMKGDVKKGDVTRGMSAVCAAANPNAIPATTAAPLGCEECSTIEIKVEKSGTTCTATAYEGYELKINEIVVQKYDNFYCSQNKTWMSGDDTITFSSQAKKEEDTSIVGYIIGGAVGGVAVVLIIFVVIFKCFISKKTTTANEEKTKRLEEDKKKNKKKSKRGENDEILEEVDVEAPDDLQL